jgi:hypothetical protein
MPFIQILLCYLLSNQELKMVSPYEANILDFNYLVTEKPELLSDEDLVSLETLLSNLPEDIEKISDELALWCEDHPKVLDALLELPPTDTGERGPGGRPARLKPKEALELLDNIVRQSKPDSNPPSSQPQTPSKP